MAVEVVLERLRADAALLADLASRPPGAADLQEWLVTLGECQRLINTLTAAQDAAIARAVSFESEYAETGEVTTMTAGLGHVAEDGVDLVALATGVTRRHCASRVDLAVRWAADGQRGSSERTGLSQVHEAMRAGRIDAYRAWVVTSELLTTPPEYAVAILAAIDPHLDHETGPWLRRRIRQLQAKWCPQVLQERAAQARSDVRLTRRAREPGVDEWIGTFAAEDALPAWAAIDALAQRYRREGTQTNLGRARAQALLDLVLGHATVTTQVVVTVPQEQPGDESAQSGSADPSPRSEGGRAEPGRGERGADSGRGNDTGGGERGQGGGAGESGGSHAGEHSEGAHAAGQGQGGGVREPRGSHASEHSEGAHAAGQGQGGGVREPRGSRASEHSDGAHAGGQGQGCGVGEPRGSSGVSHAPEPVVGGFVVDDRGTVGVTDPVAAEVDPALTAESAAAVGPVRAAESAMLVEVTSSVTGSLPLFVAADWLPPPTSTMAVHPLTGTLVDPEGALSRVGYRPGAALVRLVRMRDGCCRFPGCTRPALRCDLDHAQAWPGGPTAAANLHALCRHHHRLKQRAGWSVRLDPLTAQVTWTTPVGTTHTTTAVDHRGRVQIPMPSARDCAPPPERAVERMAFSAVDYRVEHLLRRCGFSVRVTAVRCGNRSGRGPGQSCEDDYFAVLRAWAPARTWAAWSRHPTARLTTSPAGSGAAVAPDDPPF